MYFSDVKSLIILMLLPVLVVGCEGADWADPGPKDVFEQFLLNLAMGENELAFAAIEADDRATITKALKTLKLPDEAMPKPHDMLVVTGVNNPFELKSIDVDPKLEAEPKPGTRVRLTLHFNGDRNTEAFMIWDGNAWFVDLPLDSKG